MAEKPEYYREQVGDCKIWPGAHISQSLPESTIEGFGKWKFPGDAEKFRRPKISIVGESRIWIHLIDPEDGEENRLGRDLEISEDGVRMIVGRVSTEPGVVIDLVGSYEFPVMPDLLQQVDGGLKDLIGWINGLTLVPAAFDVSSWITGRLQNGRDIIARALKSDKVLQTQS